MTNQKMKFWMGFVFEQDRVRGGYYWTPVRSEWQCLDLRGRIAAQSNQGTRALSTNLQQTLVLCFREFVFLLNQKCSRFRFYHGWNGQQGGGRWQSSAEFFSFYVTNRWQRKSQSLFCCVFAMTSPSTGFAARSKLLFNSIPPVRASLPGSLGHK